MTNSIRQTLSQIRKGLKELTADSRLTNKFLYARLIATASIILKRQSDALKLANIHSAFQTYKCISLQPVSAADGNCMGITSRRKLYRSTIQLPELYEDGDGPIIGSISSLDNSRRVKLVTMNSLQRASQDTNSKYDDTVYAYLDDRYLYLTRNVPVNVDAVFKEDISRYNCTDCLGTNDPCKPFLDTTWYMPDDLANATITTVLNELLQSYRKIPEQQQVDKNNNT